MDEVVEATVVTEKKIRESIINFITSSVNVITMDKAVESAAVPDQQNGESFEAGLLTEKYIAAASTNFWTMDETLKYSAIPDQHNE